jgi:hypothetical protein
MAGIMAPEKNGSRTRRKTGADVTRVDSGSGRRKDEKKAGQDGGVPLVDVDPWGSFFEMFWEPAGGEGADQHDAAQEQAKGTRTAGMRRGGGRSPRAA